MEHLTDLAENLGVFTTADARAHGMDGKSIARAVRCGEWHRIRRGAFVAGESWRAADAERRHLIRAAAIHRSYGDRVAFSHTTAALIHGLAIWDHNLDRVHVTRRDAGAGRTERDIVHHEGFPDTNELTHVGPWLVVDPVRAALETGSIATPDSALVTVNDCLHSGHGTKDDFAERYTTFQHWPGSQHLQVVLRLADARVQSPGESRCLWFFWINGIPMPELQYPVYDEAGRLVGIVDFAWPKLRLLGEFDGRAKYVRYLRNGERSEDVVFAEKRREDELRRVTGFGMIRYAWSDFSDPVAMCRRTMRMLDAAA